MSTAEQVARQLLDQCAGQRAYWAKSETFDPRRARGDRKYAAEKGWASEYDDPNLTVRASVVEQLCRQVLGDPS